MKVFTSQELTFTLQGNANELLVYFDTQSNYNIIDVDVKSVILKTSAVKRYVTIMLIELADSTILPPYIIEKLSNAEVPIELIVMCESKGWMAK